MVGALYFSVTSLPTYSGAFDKYVAYLFGHDEEATLKLRFCVDAKKYQLYISPYHRWYKNEVKQFFFLKRTRKISYPKIFYDKVDFIFQSTSSPQWLPAYALIASNANVLVPIVHCWALTLFIAKITIMERNVILIMESSIHAE